MAKNIFKIIAMSVAVGLVFAAAGCSAQGTQTSETTQEEAQDYSNSTVSGMVMSVDGDSVTVSLQEDMQGEPPEMSSDNSQGEKGEAPEKPSDNSQSENGEAPEKPSDNSQSENGEAPEKPSDNSQSENGEAPEKPSDNSQSENGEAPEKPSDNSQSENGEAPEKPSNNSQSENGEAPEKPSDNSQSENGEVPEMPQGEEFTFELTDDIEVTSKTDDTEISQGDRVEITFGDNNTVESIEIQEEMQQGGMGMPGGQNDGDNGSAANTITEETTIDGESYSSQNEDENAIRIDGATATLNNISVEKTGENTSNDNSNFYGANAGLLALNGAQVTINGGSFNTDASGANAVFSYGEGTTVNISDVSITTSKDNSGGIQTAGGGTTNASNLTVTTSGNSSAAIRSDRGGGIVTVDGGTYETNGTGSPAIYSTADITVSNAQLTANASEGIVVEGENSVSLENCNVSGNMQGTYNDENENIHGVMIYQSMSGDADEGTASFSSVGGSITAQAGDLFYVTNTSCEISLENTQLSSATGTVLKVQGNDGSRGWGEEGSNGGTVKFSVKNQTIEGDIIVDDISSLDMNLTEGSTLKGAVNSENSGGEINVTLDSSSTWTLTGDSYITSFNGDTSSINTNGYSLYVNGEKLL